MRRIAQLNINHSAIAQDLMEQTIMELRCEMIVVCEPYKNLQCDEWVADQAGTVAIYKNRNMASPSLRMVAAGNGFVVAK